MKNNKKPTFFKEKHVHSCIYEKKVVTLRANLENYGQNYV